MSFDFTHASNWTPYFLASATELSHTELFSHSIDIGFSLLADNEGNEEAYKGWVLEPNRH